MLKDFYSNKILVLFFRQMCFLAITCLLLIARISFGSLLLYGQSKTPKNNQYRRFYFNPFLLLHNILC
jgi:hypothetical protein